MHDIFYTECLQKCAHNADAVSNVRYEISEKLQFYGTVIVLVLFLFSHCRLVVYWKKSSTIGKDISRCLETK